MLEREEARRRYCVRAPESKQRQAFVSLNPMDGVGLGISEQGNSLLLIVSSKIKTP